MSPRKTREPKQTAFIKAAPPPAKNGDILDVDEAAALLKVSKKTIYTRVKAHTIPHARLGRRILFSRARLTQWVSDGADLAHDEPDGGQLSLDKLPGMLNNGQARIGTKR